VSERPTLFTASWTTLYRADRAGALTVQPVRISHGKPRFWPYSADFLAAPELFIPRWMFGSDDREKNERAYRHQLHELGASQLATLFYGIGGRADGNALAFACFEADRAGCHRGWLARWWEQERGERMPDLALLTGVDGKAALVYNADDEPRHERGIVQLDVSRENHITLPFGAPDEAAEARR